jgi:hypothetical protein
MTRWKQSRGNLLFTLGQNLEGEFGAGAAKFHGSVLVEAQQVHVAVPGDRFGQHLFVRGFGEVVYEPSGEGVVDFLGREGADPHKQVGRPAPESPARQTGTPLGI